MSDLYFANIATNTNRLLEILKRQNKILENIEKDLAREKTEIPVPDYCFVTMDRNRCVTGVFLCEEDAQKTGEQYVTAPLLS